MAILSRMYREITVRKKYFTLPHLHQNDWYLQTHRHSNSISMSCTQILTFTCFLIDRGLKYPSDEFPARMWTVYKFLKDVLPILESTFFKILLSSWGRGCAVATHFCAKLSKGIRVSVRFCKGGPVVPFRPIDEATHRFSGISRQMGLLS